MDGCDIMKYICGECTYHYCGKCKLVEDNSDPLDDCCSEFKVFNKHLYRYIKEGGEICQ